MPQFETFVARMSLGERTELWLTLKELHDSVHPSDASDAVEYDGTSRSELSEPLEDAGCTRAHCSHSDPNCTVAQWFCTFGENASFWAYDEVIE